MGYFEAKKRSRKSHAWEPLREENRGGGCDGELIDETDDEIKQGKRWDGELINGTDGELEQGKRWGDGLDGELIRWGRE